MYDLVDTVCALGFPPPASPLGTVWKLAIGVNNSGGWAWQDMREADNHEADDQRRSKERGSQA